MDESGSSSRGVHRESVSGWAGFSLGFVHHSPRSAGSGLLPVSVDSVPLDYCDGPGECRLQRFGVLYFKLEFAVQDAIKTPKLKPAQPETLSR